MIAGAGFGKSTLIREWSRGRRIAWLALRDEPARTGDLAASIVDALKQVGIDGPLGVAGGSHVEFSLEQSRAETQAGIIAMAIEESALDDLYLVIDDLHSVPEEQSAVLPALVRQAPAQLRVIVLSRSAPRFAVQRLRAHGDLVEIGIDDLAFDADEIRRLVAGSLGSGDDALAARLLEMTNGWPALVRILIESLRAVPPAQRQQTLDRPQRSGETVFPYLAEEVFEAEPQRVRDLVRTVAELDAFDADLCTDLGFPDAPAILDDLRRRGLFVEFTPGLPRRLALHRLIRDYATRRMPLSAEQSARVREAAARWLGRSGDPEGAMSIAIALPTSRVLIELLRQHGEGLLVRGRASVLTDAGRRLGADDLDEDLTLLLGDAAMHLTDARAALAYYMRLLPKGAPTPAAVGWRIGRLYFERSEFRRAAAALADARLDGATDRDRARLLAWRAMSAWHSEEPGAYELATRAAEIATRAGDLGAVSIANTAACYASLTREDDTPLVHFATAMRAADEAGDLIQQTRLRNAGTGYASLVEQADALEAIIPAVKAAGNVRWLARALHARALCLIDLGRYDEADTDLRRSVEVSQGLGQGDIGPSLFLADLRRIVGDLGEATTRYRAILSTKSDDRHLTAFAKAGLARVLGRTEPDVAMSLATEALAEVLPHERATMLVSAGWVCLAAGRRDEAESYGAEALREARAGSSGDPRSILGYALELGALASTNVTLRRARLEEAQAFWTRLGNRVEESSTSLALANMGDGPNARATRSVAIARIRAAGVRPSAADAAGFLGELPRERPPAIEVRTFGAFQVLRGGAPVPVGEWRSKKPRDLLKILIARRGAVPRDELMETLWPDENPVATSNRLSVALSLLRAVLDPPRRQAADAFVSTDRGAIRLDASDIVIDIEDFLHDAREGLELRRRGQAAAALDRLITAEALYGGDLFEEDAYADWAVAPREETRSLYIQVARAIAELLAEVSDHDGSARYVMRILTRDPFDEAAHLALVTALIAGRHHGEARRAYQQYVARMAELSIEPAPYPRLA